MAGSGKGKANYKVLCGLCPDEQCQSKLYFRAYEASIECTGCGQRHDTKACTSIEEVTNPEVAIHNILKNILLGSTKPKKGTDLVKVLGLSNYKCKLLSPLLTKYGMDKQTGEAKLLQEMGQSAMFDVGILGDRAFLIEPDRIEVVGYGRDKTGSMKYLENTLKKIKTVNNGEERLLPIHADGDGHCLVHATSRALVGRELFWHALRENLKVHFQSNLATYKNLFQDFIDVDEWRDIIEECDPYFIPPNGEPLGMRNIHIFGLANVLKRPIVLLDSLQGMQSSGDYSGVFLPGLLEPDKCRGKDGTLNKPICLAWSNQGHNHYIALVGVKGRPVPKLPQWMVRKAWGVPQSQIQRYMELDKEGFCVIGGEKCLQEKYILRLATAMEKEFQTIYGVNADLVADVHQYVYKFTGIVGVSPETVLEETKDAVGGKRLYRCLLCDGVAIWNVDQEWFKPGGMLYKTAISTHGPLSKDKVYSFPHSGMVCGYDVEKDELVPDMKKCQPTNCRWCKGVSTMRVVQGDGSITYSNGDRTSTASNKSRCQCGFKHYWDGEEYDNLPEMFPISLEWNGKVVAEKVVWFQYESNPVLNSNVYEVAQSLVQKHFPGEFGSERLVQKVVDTILRQTAAQQAAASQEGKQPTDSMGQASSSEGGSGDMDSNWQKDTASKIIISGHKNKTLHKEELTMSETEKSLRKRISANAPAAQRRRAEEMEQSDKAKVPPKETNVASDEVSAVEPLPKSQIHQETVSEMKVRVTTVDGKQVTLTINPQTTYAGFRELVSKELQIQIDDLKKIKYGFPPKELIAPGEGQEGDPVPLQHGDRVTVEIKQPEAEVPVDQHSATHAWPAPENTRQAWSGFEANSRDLSEAQMLQSLATLQDAHSDSLDTSIASLSLMATLTGRDVWSHVQSMPHLFSVGGLYYEQVKRDLGLSDGKHCQLPSLKGKVFRFNARDDRLELCLEPHGHFPIEPGIEAKVLKADLLSHSQTTSATPNVKDASGSSTPSYLINREQSSHTAFSGKGHSMISGTENIRMPHDLSPVHHRHKAMKFQDFAQSTGHPDSIVEECEEGGTVKTDSTDHTGTADILYTRKGPGYSVINPELTNAVSATAQLINNLTSDIQAMVDETSTSDCDMQEAGPSDSEANATRMEVSGDTDLATETGTGSMDTSVATAPSTDSTCMSPHSGDRVESEKSE